MSIAASAIVAPSRRLRALSAGYACANLAAAAVGVALRDRYQAAPLCASFFLGAGLCLLHAALRKTKTLRIDVSGVGQVRLTVQQDLRTNDTGAGPASTPVALLAGSTVWPQLMLLLLRSGSGAVTVLPVLRDSVAPGQFRALAVAVRAAGGRDAAAPYHPFAGTHKIL